MSAKSGGCLPFQLVDERKSTPDRRSTHANSRKTHHCYDKTLSRHTYEVSRLMRARIQRANSSAFKGVISNTPHHGGSRVEGTNAVVAYTLSLPSALIGVRQAPERLPRPRYPMPRHQAHSLANESPGGPSARRESGGGGPAAAAPGIGAAQKPIPKLFYPLRGIDRLRKHSYPLVDR